MSELTKIAFTDKHLQVIETALEVYTRLRLGQIDIALDEAFPDYCLSWEERQHTHNVVRSILFPEYPRLTSDGHGGYYDQFGCSYDEDGNRDTPETYQEKARNKRPKLSGGPSASFGISNKQVKDGDIAYEIRQTIRQFLSLKRNNGFFEWFTNFDDPLKVSDEPLPIIEKFQKGKSFLINDDKLKVCVKKKKWKEAWEIVDDFMKTNHPEIDLHGIRKIQYNRKSKMYELFVEKPIKKFDSKL